MPWSFAAASITRFGPSFAVNRLAPAELGVAGIEKDRGAAQVLDARLEGQSSTGRLLLEDHHQRAIGQRVIGLIALVEVLDDAAAGKDMLDLVAIKVDQLQEVL
jgi:hypothetical protein